MRVREGGGGREGKIQSRKPAVFFRVRMRVREGGGGREGKIRLVTIAPFTFQIGM